MQAPDPSLPHADAPRALARLARAAALGHFDELRGAACPAQSAPPVAPWARFLRHLEAEGAAGLDRRAGSLARQVRDNGVTYNVYADAKGPQRPWSLDLFPLILTPQSWQQVEAGVLQRMQLLEAVMADAYGPQRLLARNLLPPALVHGHPGYLRQLHGGRPAGGRHLHIAAFDLARGADGRWWVVSQRTQAPSGLGYLLENRLVISRLFPEAFSELRVQRLAASYAALADGLRAMSPSPAGESPRLVLLTPGPYNETYFEHAFLARHLGLTLVEGSDLTVRHERLYLKTLNGLEPVHGILKRLDDEFLDPLELRADSRLGVPGLLQAIRAGHVLVANAPGSAFLESTALLGFLPALARELLGQELQLPSLPTWWCGERAALEAVIAQLGSHVIKPTYTAPGSGAVLGHALSRRALDEWSGRLLRQSDDFTVQSYLPLSQLPTWDGHRLSPRSLLLRVFAVPDARGGWRVLPGGLTRLAGATQETASMQRGGSSADTWVMTHGEIDRAALPVTGPAATPASQRARIVTSRAAENLFWLGRYTERTENTARLARLLLKTLNGEDQATPPVLAWIDAMATAHALVLPGVPPATQSRRVFERSLIAALADTQQATSVGFNLAGIRHAASTVRERLSLEQWNLVVQAEQAFQAGCASCTQAGDYDPLEAARVLERLSVHMAAITGAQTDRMVRDDGWRLLSIGRHLERLSFLAQALAQGFESEAVFEPGGFDALLALFDSALTFQAVYQSRRDVQALLELLVLDRDNPRALAWVAQSLRGRLARIEGLQAPLLPDPAHWNLQALCVRDASGQHGALLALLQSCADAARQLSDTLTTRCFTHSGDAQLSVGA